MSTQQNIFADQLAFSPSPPVRSTSEASENHQPAFLPGLVKRIREHLYPLWQIFEAEGGQEEELVAALHELAALPVTNSTNNLFFADEWASQLPPQLDVAAAQVAQQLLRHLYLIFEASPIFEHFVRKFGLPKAQLLAEIPAQRLLDWLGLWLTHRYPPVALFLFGKAQQKVFASTRMVQLEALVLHLPCFLLWQIRTYLRHNQRKRLVFELARGVNVRQAKHAPLAFTRKMAHCFHHCPRDYDFSQAEWYAIIYGLAPNIDWPERRALLFQVLLRHGDKALDFLAVVIPFFLRQAEDISAEELQQLLGYLQHLQDEREAISLKGATISSLRRAADHWYRTLAQHIPTPALESQLKPTWSGASYRPFRLEEEDRVYEIVQLNSRKKLAEEGQLMMHCVGTYAWKCQLHAVSIWSLRQTKDERCRRLVTLEISKDHEIVQARKMFNANPDTNDRRLISRWAKREGIRFIED